jgi:hypothetical protein
MAPTFVQVRAFSSKSVRAPVPDLRREANEAS